MTDIGKKLKKLREKKKMTLDELAQQSGVTSSYISQVERALINPSIAKLSAMAKGLGISLGELFNNGSTTESRSNHNPLNVQIVRKDMRKSFSLPKSNTEYFLLSPDLKRKIEFVLTVAPPFSSSGEDIYHEGEEACFILKGTMLLIIESQQYVLNEGDSVYFDSTLPHRWENQSSEELRAVWVITPPSF
ncbi:MAG: XRE family transcriptional regulator [Firmicutes bacterium HGW-Firmicutes-14]|jgi:transcriptional regulator with XRE-family HTH domain|nr:MAG: XRE family transcriptional regulator [Firmicutes bacterium HGW-Firmicutes-14]